MSSIEFNWHAPADHPAFAGHFPGRPIVPGVVLLDQAILFAEKMLGYLVAQWQIGQAKFFNPAQPEQALTFTLTSKGGAAIGFIVRSGELQIASGSLTPATR